jgi:hypothetical protein
MGSTDPGTGNQFAIYGYEPDDGCYYPSVGPCTGVNNIAPVGTASLGAGRWGQVDLMGIGPAVELGPTSRLLQRGSVHRLRHPGRTRGPARRVDPGRRVRRCPLVTRNVVNEPGCARPPCARDRLPMRAQPVT